MCLYLKLSLSRSLYLSFSVSLCKYICMYVFIKRKRLKILYRVMHSQPIKCFFYPNQIDIVFARSYQHSSSTQPSGFCLIGLLLISRDSHFINFVMCRNCPVWHRRAFYQFPLRRYKLSELNAVGLRLENRRWKWWIFPDSLQVSLENG